MAGAFNLCLAQKGGFTAMRGKMVLCVRTSFEGIFSGGRTSVVVVWRPREQDRKCTYKVT